MTLKMSCKEATRRLSEAQDGELPASELTRLRLHLAVCEACRRVEQQLQLLRYAIRSLGGDEAPLGDGQTPRA